MTRPKSPGALQLAILHVLWRRREARVAEVHEALRPERALALTTIATMLRKMEDRELVSHRLEVIERNTPDLEHNDDLVSTTYREVATESAPDELNRSVLRLSAAEARPRAARGNSWMR